MMKIQRRNMKDTGERNPRQLCSNIVGGSWPHCGAICFFQNSWESRLSHVIICFWEVSRSLSLGSAARVTFPNFKIRLLFFKYWDIKDVFLTVLLQYQWLERQCKFPWLSRWLSGKEYVRQCRRWGFDPWVRKTLWRRKWQPTPVFLLGKSHGQMSLGGYSPWGCKESNMT